jgi:hypothetical protein
MTDQRILRSWLRIAFLYLSTPVSELVVGLYRNPSTGIEPFEGDLLLFKPQKVLPQTRQGSLA